MGPGFQIVPTKFSISYFLFGRYVFAFLIVNIYDCVTVCSSNSNWGYVLCTYRNSQIVFLLNVFLNCEYYNFHNIICVKIWTLLLTCRLFFSTWTCKTLAGYLQKYPGVDSVSFALIYRWYRRTSIIYLTFYSKKNQCKLN